MRMHALRLRIFAFVAGAAVLACSGWAGADPPARVARLGYMSGAVSFSPAGENDWVQAAINRPMTTSDRLWADAGARAEIQVGGTMIRMNADTGVSILNLDDRIAQLQLTQGTLNVRVRRLDPSQVFEVDTPNLAFTLRQPGEYRIEVDPDGNATTIVVRKGQGEVYGEDAAYVVDSRQPYRFTGTGLREYQYVDAPRLDEFDRWAGERDRRYDNSASARYVSQDVVGYQDLDANGTWRTDANYGNVWFPSRVDAGWAPYRDGHWAWVDPWGWTWVDDAPWGFAVSHYGRWTNLRGTWGWVPGPARTRAYYAPALVAFVGGDNFQLAVSGANVGGVAWFPLGPREVYRPSYPVSRGYFENINRSNTVINNTVIKNYYNNTNVTNVVYVNRQVPGAVVAVPRTAFVQSQPVSTAAVRVSRETIVRAPVALVAAVAPTEKSVRGAAVQGGKPPPRVFERPVVARTAPPAAHMGFAAQQQQLSAKPGKALDDAARKELKPAAAAPAPVVNVVARTQKAPPTMRPPPAAPGAKAGDAGGKSAERKAAATPAISGASGAPTQGAAPAQATPPIAAVPEQRGKSESRGRAEQRGQAIAPPVPPPGAAPISAVPQKVAPPQGIPPVPAAPPKVAPAPVAAPAAPAKVAPPQGAVPAPAALPQAAPPQGVAPAQQRGRPEQRGQREQSVQPAAPPSPPRAAEPKAVPPQAAPPKTAPPQAAQPQAAPAQAAPPQAVPPTEQRGKSEQRGQREQRGQPAAPSPPPRAAEAKAVPPQVTPPSPATQAAPPRPAEPTAARPALAAPPAPAAQPQRPKAEPAPAAKPAEQRPPLAAPKAPPPPPPPKAEPRAGEPTPAAGKQTDRKNDSDEQKREEENRRQRR